MNKKGKRLREFEKKNREFSFRPKREKVVNIAGDGETVDVKTEVKEQRKPKKKVVLNVKRFVMSAIIVVFVVSVGVSGFKLVALQREYNQLAKRQEELKQLKETLTAELKYVDSNEYIEQQARKSLKLVKDNEILFLLPEGEDTNKDKDNGKTEN